MSQSTSVTENRSTKRARITEPPTANHRSLPVVGLHMALIGPNHLTKLFATSLLRRDTVDRSAWNLQDRIALQQLERRYASRSTVTEQHYVHLYEPDHHALPNPCHIVYVIACDPRTVDPDNLYRHANIQHALRECRRHDPTHVSLLLCFDTNAPTVESFVPAVHSPPYYEPTVLTCWHPQNESSRQAVAQSLWKRCRLSHRVGVGSPSPWLYEQVD
jgi:hypothetical protein